MRKKKQNSVRENSNNGFENLINMHTMALENNSEMIASMLQVLSNKKLSRSDKESLNKIRKGLNRLNKDLDKLGDD